MPKVTKDGRAATTLLFELLQEHKRAFHTLVKEVGLTPQQAATILSLEPGVGTPMSVIAEFLMCDASNVTGIVDKLEARGLATRVSAEDRRVKALTLTTEGEALKESMRTRLHSPPAWMEELTRDEQRALHESLQRAVTVMREAGKS